MASTVAFLAPPPLLTSLSSRSFQQYERHMTSSLTCIPSSSASPHFSSPPLQNSPSLHRSTKPVKNVQQQMNSSNGRLLLHLLPWSALAGHGVGTSTSNGGALHSSCLSRPRWGVWHVGGLKPVSCCHSTLTPRYHLDIILCSHLLEYAVPPFLCRNLYISSPNLPPFNQRGHPAPTVNFGESHVKDMPTH
jgi:hypothetical protein